MKRVKWENIFLILIAIPMTAIQFIRADSDYKIASILLSLILYSGIYLIIKMIRKEN